MSVNKVDNLFALSRFWIDESHIKKSCLTSEEMRKYANGKEYIYGWHISDLKIYDKPKELGEFYAETGTYDNNDFIATSYYDNDTRIERYMKYIKRPPQNFVYIEEIRCCQSEVQK